MVSCKWLLKFSRNCTYWSTRVQPTILSKNVFDSYKNSIIPIIDNGVKGSVLLNSVEIKDRIKRIAEYYMLGPAQVQGELTVLAYDMLQNSNSRSDELQHQAHLLSSCVEMVMAYILIIDDIEDNAKTRCGKPCWHLLPDVGSLAMNDASILRSFTINLLQQNFKDRLLTDILQILNEAYYKCAVGQFLDAITAKTRNYNEFTTERYQTIALYKYAFYSVKFPILSALILSNKLDTEARQNVVKICTDIGILNQINNDFTDYYDDDIRTGKTGSDIEAGKCTWLSVTALERCNDAQKQIFAANYGSWEPEHVNRIRDLYEELKITELYFQEERARCDSIISAIHALPANATPSPEFFHTVFDKLYTHIKRNTHGVKDKHEIKMM